ncbi:taste receptor type 2 member 125-like [Meriones unguiculatus]|uniref:taste receptor type 2 member 125-like n=1 Tax=Meriones unguiculatus TaxID=10047 RepID=UPI000B4F973C|nr:taste receptor type 2 member 125-like [Meriones unguiculatus]
MNVVTSNRHCGILLQAMDAIKNMVMTIFIFEFFIGNLLNGFIALVNCLDWVQRRKISPVDEIITALAVSRVAQLWLVEVNILLFLTHSVKLTEIVTRLTNIAWVVTSHFNLWLSTQLSIVYLLKIVKFSNSIFLYLKWRIRQVVSVTLVLSLALLFLNIMVINTHVDVWVDVTRGDSPHNFSSRNSTPFLKHILFTNSVFASIPFTVSLVAFLLLIFSLWKHKKKMHDSSRGSRDSNTLAHEKALKTGIAFLSINAIFLLTLIVNVCSTQLKDNYIILLFSVVTGITFSSCHSCVLILASVKLRQASLSVLWWRMCRTKDAGSCGP